MKNFINKGITIDHVATGAIVSGDIVVVGKLVGIAATSAASGESVAIQLVGTFILPKGSGAITQGAKVYFDATNSNITTTVSSNAAVGHATLAAASGDAEVEVRLNQF